MLLQFSWIYEQETMIFIAMRKIKALVLVVTEG